MTAEDNGQETQATLADLGVFLRDRFQQQRGAFELVVVLLESLVYPVWCKRVSGYETGREEDLQFDLVYANRAFVAKWGAFGGAEHYDEASIWGPDVAAEIRSHDVESFRNSPSTTFSKEAVQRRSGCSLESTTSDNELVDVARRCVKIRGAPHVFSHAFGLDPRTTKARWDSSEAVAGVWQGE